ncbi:MAG: maleylpyruvate isomerase family mycothiol-dependent enzyme [Chloroflexi bacterium]|nr:maleylpyruvate isomerase family mycothiol-dependent enzyme [Chloroflexota bacterium]
MRGQCEGRHRGGSLITNIDSTKQLVDLIRSESERFKELVGALPSNALENRSPCERWNVGDVIAHLIWFAEKYGGMMEHGLQGDQSPPEGFPVVPGTMKGPAIAKLYGDSAIELRRGLGERLIPEFCERYDWLNDMLKRIGPDDWDKSCYHTAKIRPVESFLPTIVGELAVHEWDIRSTQEPSPALSKNAVPVLMAKIPGNRRPWSIPFPDSPASPGPIRYRFDLTGAFPGKHDVIVENGNARLEPAGDAVADVSIRCQSEMLVLLMYGRLTLDSAAAADLVKVEGDGELVSSFDRWLKADS